MKRIDIVKDGDQWKGKSGDQTVRGTKAPRKEDSIKQTAETAKADADPVSVRIHKEDGTIQEERTYPRKADPKRTKG